MCNPRRMKWQTYKVDTDCADVAVGVCVVRKAKQQARLSDAGVSDEEKLEKIVAAGQGVSGTRLSQRADVSQAPEARK